ncbi:unnamed protein product [Symbiodinium sp. CCMP2592]|nr:unnamed protein product [Symbiodinium sp. CCMP2592]
MSARALEIQSLGREINSVRELLGQLEARLQALEEEKALPVLLPNGRDEVELISPWPSTSEEVFPDRSCRAQPGGPTSIFRTQVAREVHLRSSCRSALTLQSRLYIVLADFEGRRFREPLVFSSFGAAKALCIRGPDKGQSIFVGLPSQAEVLTALQEAGLSWPSAGLDGQPDTPISRVLTALQEAGLSWPSAGLDGQPDRVLAASEDDPGEPQTGVRLKVWLGMLHQPLEECIDFGVDGELEPDVPFLGFGSRSQERLDPYGPSLSAIASEHFAFLTLAEEGGPPHVESGGEGSAWEHRLTRLEAGLAKMQESMQALLDGAPLSDGASQGRGIGSLAEAPSRRPALAGLDPSVVEAARKAGVPEEQLVRMSRLATKSGKLSEAKARPKAKAQAVRLDPLDESEDEALPGAGGTGAAGASDPVSLAVVQIGQVLQALHRERDRKNDLEDLLDLADSGAGEALGATTGGSRSKTAAYLKLRGVLRSSPELISSSIVNLIHEDFVGAQTGSHQGERHVTVRGWLEHRSHLQSYAGPIRQGWTLATIVDLINSGNVDQAKATALLAIAALDQAAIDSGTWLLAAEFAMDTQPPFGSFQHARVLDSLEARQTRIIDPRWVSLYMSRIRERDAFHTAKKNLSSGSGGGGGTQIPPGGGGETGTGGGDAGKPPRRPPKGPGKGKDKEKEGAK